MWDAITNWLAASFEFRAIQVYPYLFQASKISRPEDVTKIQEMGITVVIDLEGGLDIPMPFLKSYLWWPILDIPILPDPGMLETAASFGWGALVGGERVLVHCRQGLNRSGLVCGKIMGRFNMKGPDILKAIREKVPGALWNQCFAGVVEGL
jgi:protein-tyrosine phosphatase